MYFIKLKNDVFNKTNLKVFSIVFFSGILIHLFGLVNVLHNYDDIGSLPSGFGAGTRLGRWFLTIIGKVVRRVWGVYNLSYFNGIVFILFLAISVCFVMNLLKINSSKIGVLIGLVMVSFPTVTSTLFFRYTSPFYGLAILLAVISAWVVERGRYGFLLSMGCTALSLGIYQAYLPLTISLIVISLIKNVLEEEINIISFFKKCMLYCISLIGGLIIYYIFLKICLIIFNVTLNDYQGISSMGNVGMFDMPKLIFNAILTVLILPFKDYCQIAPTFVLKFGYICIYILSVVLILTFIYKNKEKINNIIMILLLMIVFPLAINFIYVMCPNSSIYTLMVLSFCMLLIFAIVIYYVSVNQNIGNFFIRKALLIVISVMVLNYIYLDNYNYTAMYYTNRQTENYMNALVVQVRMSHGFDENKKWAFIGDNFNDSLAHNVYADEIPLYGGNLCNYYNSYTKFNWPRYYFGYTLPMADDNVINELKNNVEVKNMPCWPNEGSIKVIGDNVVIKLEDIKE